MGKTARTKNDKQEARRLQQLLLPFLGALSSMRVTLLELVFRIGFTGITTLLEQERTMLVGTRYKHNAERAYTRAGHDQEGELVLGGRKVKFPRPRVRTVKDANGKSVEVPLEAWEAFSKEDPLTERALEQMLVGVTTRKYARSLEDLPNEISSHSISKSSVSRRFVEATTEALATLMSANIAELDIWALMLDGKIVGGHTVIAALGIDRDGNKHPLGVWEGATENAEVCKSLLMDLVDRGLPTNRSLLIVIDGGKAIAKAVRDVFGKRAVIQRCQVHKRRNVLEHLPESQRKSVGATISTAYRCRDSERALQLLKKLARYLEKKHPGAAASLREGMEETLTVLRFGLPETLERTFASTNVIENLNGTMKRVSRNVKNWQDGTMALRWFAAAMAEAQKGFRRLKGYPGMKILIAALRAHDDAIDGRNEKSTEELAQVMKAA